MFAKIGALMQWRSDLLIAERYEDLAREYTFPMAMYMDAKMLVVRDSDHMVQIWMQLQASRKLRGVTQLVAKITALEVPRNGRFRVWVRHHELDANQQMITLTDAVHYCRETDHGIRGEMAEFGRCSIPEIWETDQRRLAGKS